MANPVIKWKVIEHSLSRMKGKHVILVAYQPNGGLNKVLGFAPLYDLRDADLNGSVSLGERLYGWWYPYVAMGNLAEVMDQWSCITEVARQLKDFDLWGKANVGALQAAFETCAVAQTTMMVDQILMPGVQLTLAKSALAEMTRLGGVVPFVVEKSFRWLVFKSLTWSCHAARPA
jgi:hypothetical protein